MRTHGVAWRRPFYPALRSLITAGKAPAAMIDNRFGLKRPPPGNPSTASHNQKMVPYGTIIIGKWYHTVPLFCQKHAFLYYFHLCEKQKSPKNRAFFKLKHKILNVKGFCRYRRRSLGWFYYLISARFLSSCQSLSTWR